MRLGLVGAGEVAWQHAAAAAEVAGLTLTAVTDRTPERAARLAERFGVTPVAGFDEVLTAADLIVLAVPHADHEQLTVRAAAAGCQVLVEKPMATTVEGCDRMKAAAGPRLHVGQQGRFFAQVQAARAELPGLGRPLRYRERRSTDYARPGRPAWFSDAAVAGGGIAMLVGVHSIDRACWLLGSTPVAVAGSVAIPAGWSVETAATATLFFADGMRADLTLVDSPTFFHETTIVCERGTLLIEPDGLSVKLLGRSRTPHQRRLQPQMNPARVDRLQTRQPAERGGAGQNRSGHRHAYAVEDLGRNARIEHRAGRDVERSPHVGPQHPGVRVGHVVGVHRLHPEAGVVGDHRDPLVLQQPDRQQRPAKYRAISVPAARWKIRPGRTRTTRSIG